MDLHADRLLLANSERVFVLDATWRALAETTHPWMGGVHDVLADEDGFWVCCTSADLLVKFSWDGSVLREWEWRGDDALRGRLDLSFVTPIDRSLDYRDPAVPARAVSSLVHLNSLSKHSEGLVVSLGRVSSRRQVHRARIRSMISRFSPKRQLPRQRGSGRPASLLFAGSSNARSAIILLEATETKLLRLAYGTSVPDHNGILTDNTLVYNDTNNDRVVESQIMNSQNAQSISIPGNPAFVRRLMQIGPRRFLVGSQAPAAVHEVDFAARKLVRSLPIGGEPHESVYAVCGLTENFNDPPANLQL